MEQLDIQLIEQHKTSNYELNRLYNDHLQLEEQIDHLEKQALSVKDQQQLSSLKYKKLQGRQEIEKILFTLR